MTKLEEIARAMCAEIVRQYEANPGWEDAKDVIENLSEAEIARVAVESMREPSEAMVKAGFEPSLRSDTGNVWQAMIDAILNEKQAPQSSEGTEGR